MPTACRRLHEVSEDFVLIPLRRYAGRWPRRKIRRPCAPPCRGGCPSNVEPVCAQNTRRKDQRGVTPAARGLIGPDRRLTSERQQPELAHVWSRRSRSMCIEMRSLCLALLAATSWGARNWGGCPSTTRCGHSRLLVAENQAPTCRGPRLTGGHQERHPTSPQARPFRMPSFCSRSRHTEQVAVAKAGWRAGCTRG